MTGGKYASCPEALQSPHRAEPCLEPPVVGLHRIVRILLRDMEGTRNELIQNRRIRRCPVRGHLDRCAASGQGPALVKNALAVRSRLRDSQTSMTCPCWSITRYRCAPSGDFDIGLVDEPPVSGHVATRSGRLDELRCEPLRPPIDRDVVDVHATVPARRPLTLGLIRWSYDLVGRVSRCST